MAEVRFGLYCNGIEGQIGQGWKLNRAQLPAAVALLFECERGSWRGPRLWEVDVYAMEYATGLHLDVGGLRWTDVQRRWFERHMKKLVNQGKATKY